MTETTAAPVLDRSDERTLLRTLRRSGGRLTVGDAMAATGLGRDEAESGLRNLLARLRGHLEVTDSGEVVYRFDPSAEPRDRTSLWTRVKRGAWSLFVKAFKVWIVAMLVVYFLVFMALLLAMVFGKRDGDGGWGGDRRGGHRHRGGMPNFFFWYLFWSSDWGFGRRPYYGRRAVKRHGWDPGKVPFTQRVFAFVFGPDEPEGDTRAEERAGLRFVRARRGVVAAAEWTHWSGKRLHESEEELAAWLARYSGEPVVSDEGVLLHAFPELMRTTEAERLPGAPAPAWKRLEEPKELTGNSTGSDLLIGGLAGFNLVAAASAPWTIFPRLGISGTLAEIGLIWVPLIFTVIFFAVPLLRWRGVRKENRGRRHRNLRRIAIGIVYDSAVRREEGVSVAGVLEGVRHLWPDGKVGEKEVARVLEELSAELDAEVAVDAEERVVYRFPEVKRVLRAAEAERRRLRLEEQDLGPIVYSTDDDPEEAGTRDLEAFDRELARSLPALDSADYRDPYEALETEPVPVG